VETSCTLRLFADGAWRDAAPVTLTGDASNPPQRRTTEEPGASLANAQDRRRIDPTQDWQVDYWTREPGISAAQLVEAIEAAGPTVGAVREHLRK
jgi:Protein of unknown function (DUF3606)